MDEILMHEKEILGIYVSGHPLDKYIDLMDKVTDATTLDFIPDEENEGRTVAVDNMKYSMAGLINTVNIKTTRNNDTMAFITIEDLYGTIEVVVFPKVYNRLHNYLVKNTPVLVSGRASISEEEGKIICDDIVLLDSLKKKDEALKKEIWLLFDDMDSFKERQPSLNRIIRDYPGYSNVYIQLRAEKKAVKLVYTAEAGCDLKEELEKIYGEDRVIIRSR